MMCRSESAQYLGTLYLWPGNSMLTRRMSHLCTLWEQFKLSNTCTAVSPSSSNKKIGLEISRTKKQVKVTRQGITKSTLYSFSSEYIRSLF